MRLPNHVLEATKKAGIKAYYADRSVTQTWNKDRDSGDPIVYGGWYWMRTKGR